MPGEGVKKSKEGVGKEGTAVDEEKAKSEEPGEPFPIVHIKTPGANVLPS